jgi:hypothetical protein
MNFDGAFHVLGIGDLDRFTFERLILDSLGPVDVKYMMSKVE